MKKKKKKNLLLLLYSINTAQDNRRINCRRYRRNKRERESRGVRKVTQYEQAWRRETNPSFALDEKGPPSPRGYVKSYVQELSVVFVSFFLLIPRLSLLLLLAAYFLFISSFLAFFIDTNHSTVKLFR